MKPSTRERALRAVSAVLLALACASGTAQTAPGGGGSAATTFRGWVVVGHEVRTFTPCSRGTELWLAGDAEAQKAIAKAYAAAATGKRPYLPVFMELAGRLEPRPDEGFGARYAGAFHATGFVAARPGRVCAGDQLVVQRPAAGDVVRSPMTVEGRVSASWLDAGKLPVELLDADGKPLARTDAVAVGDPDARGFVDFKGVLEFTLRGGANATLTITENDSRKPSGAGQVSRIPVVLR